MSTASRFRDILVKYKKDQLTKNEAIVILQQYFYEKTNGRDAPLMDRLTKLEHAHNDLVAVLSEHVKEGEQRCLKQSEIG